MKKVVKTDFGVSPQMKEWFKSKTIWLNILALISGIILGIIGEVEAGVTLSSLSVMNIVLRSFTKMPIFMQFSLE